MTDRKWSRWCALLFCCCILVGCARGISKDNREITSDESEKIESVTENGICFSLPDGTMLQVDKARVKDSYYGIKRLDNRWELDEIDIILNSIKGKWKVGEYIGFVAPTIYFPDLWDHNNLDEDERNRLYDLYEEKTEKAASNIPDIRLYIKEDNDVKAMKNNYIYSRGTSRAVCASPISIILSLDRMDENYPVFADTTVLSTDFTAEHPVMYIKFFLMTGEAEYEPGTLVMTSDDRFYLLIDGAFYALVRSE